MSKRHIGQYYNMLFKKFYYLNGSLLYQQELVLPEPVMLFGIDETTKPHRIRRRLEELPSVLLVDDADDCSLFQTHHHAARCRYGGGGGTPRDVAPGDTCPYLRFRPTPSYVCKKIWLFSTITFLSIWPASSSRRALSSLFRGSSPISFPLRDFHGPSLPIPLSLL